MLVKISVRWVSNTAIKQCVRYYVWKTDQNERGIFGIAPNDDGENWIWTWYRSHHSMRRYVTVIDTGHIKRIALFLLCSKRGGKGRKGNIYYEFVYEFVCCQYVVYACFIFFMPDRFTKWKFTVCRFIHRNQMGKL